MSAYLFISTCFVSWIRVLLSLKYLKYIYFRVLFRCPFISISSGVNLYPLTKHLWVVWFFLTVMMALTCRLCGFVWKLVLHGIFSQQISSITFTPGSRSEFLFLALSLDPEERMYFQTPKSHDKQAWHFKERSVYNITSYFQHSLFILMIFVI